MMCRHDEQLDYTPEIYLLLEDEQFTYSLTSFYAVNLSRIRDQIEILYRGLSKPFYIPYGQLQPIMILFAIASLQKVAMAQPIFNASSTYSPSQTATSTMTFVPSSQAQTPMPFASPPPTIPPTYSHMPSVASTLRPTSLLIPSTVAPGSLPTASPSNTMTLPTAQPSLNETAFITRPCSQLLVISDNEILDEIEVGIYSLQIQSYTDAFGHYIGTPFIVTKCEVFNQALAGGRKKKRWSFFQHLKNIWDRELQTTTGTLLLIEFNIMYETRYGYDITTYPSQFQMYMNENLEQVTIDMQTRFLPVVAAKEVIVYNTDSPTVSPMPTKQATVTSSPIGEGQSVAPSEEKSLAPTVTSMPTTSVSPTLPRVGTPKPTRSDIVQDERSFVVGLAAGLSGAALVVFLFVIYTRRKIGQRNRNEATQAEESKKSLRGDIEISLGNNDDEVSPNNELEDGAIQVTSDTTKPFDVIVSNPSMISEGGSLGSNPNDIQEGVHVETLQDEFDNYKNQDLEFLRNSVEESVYGAEGMMSLAMTRALMEEEEDNVEWGGAQNCESMEANIFCEVNDWLRKNENVSLERRIEFFQAILNKMVITVRRGMVRPADGTRAIHCCAAMLRIPLESDLPNNVLLVYGMRKTNDIYQGRSHLVEAFKIFGDIETAGINPKNKGFGFVRFAHQKSVDRAFDRFKVSEIEVQDVSVMIKSLKPESQPML